MAIPDTVTIHFKPDGDDILKRAIKDLDKATKNLIKANVKLNEQKEKTTQKTTNNTNALRRLSEASKVNGQTLSTMVRNHDLLKRAA